VTPAEFLAALTWRDGVDLGLLILIAYSLLTLLRGTRVIPILLSVAFFATLGFVAKALDLVAVATLLRWFLEYVIVILIVVFSQELRRFLLRVGQRLLPGGRRQAAESAIGQLLTAVERLSKAHIGALFVLEGEIDVPAVCSDPGREIDAPLTADTLVALAVPHAANLAHDGGVLIERFRIARAAMICPLSPREDLDPRLGTRHRGAIGVSEETDALVIVLSEERGEIRVVERGAVSEPMGREQLEAAILAWLDRPPKRPGGPSPDAASSASARVAAGSGLHVVGDAREGGR
jgi:uncharacterized protein (TIGR00159 family)